MVQAILPTWQMGRLRLGGVNHLDQCHMAPQSKEGMTFRTPDSVASNTQLRLPLLHDLSPLPC